MATSIVERPYKFSFSLNEIRYVLEVTDPNTPGCEVEVELYYHALASTTGILLKGFTLTAPADGIIFCHVGDYLQSILKPQLPLISGDSVQPVTEQVKNFYIRYRQITTADSNPDWKTDEEFTRIVLLGGVEKRVFQRNNFFVSHLPTTKSFLTWQPAKRFVFDNERHYLTFLLTTGENFTVNLRTVYTDLTIIDILFDHVVTDNNVLFRVKAGAQDLQLHLINTYKQLYYYEIKITATESGEVLANSYRFYLEYRHLYSYYDLLFFNSISGLDSVRVKGVVDWSIETSSDDFEHITGNDSFGTDQPQEQFTQTNHLKQDSYKGDAGWSRTPRQQEALIEILLSKGVFEIVNNRWIGILNLNKKVDLRSSIDKKWNFPIEWSYGYNDHVFTPKEITLGVGDNILELPAPPVCIPVFITPALMPDGTVGASYNFSISLSGSAPYAINVAEKPAWMTIELSGSQVNFTGTPNVVGENLNVSISVNNCADSLGIYNDQITITAAVVVPPPEKEAYVINTLATELQLLSHGITFPSNPSLANFEVGLTEGTALRIAVVNGGSALYYRVEFLSSMSEAPIYTKLVGIGEPIMLSSDPDDAETGVNFINYIRVSET